MYGIFSLTLQSYWHTVPNICTHCQLDRWKFWSSCKNVLKCAAKSRVHNGQKLRHQFAVKQKLPGNECLDPWCLLIALHLFMHFSCLIYAQPLLAHCPAPDDNFLIGCTRPWPDRWLVAAQCLFCWQPVPISVLVWVRSFIEPDFLKTMYHSTIPLRFIWSVCSGN